MKYLICREFRDNMVAMGVVKYEDRQCHMLDVGTGLCIPL